MAYFAKVKNNVVEQIIVADQAFIDALPAEDGVSWIETCCDTKRGEHEKGGTPLRMHYAGIGYQYDSVNDCFLPPKPYESWVLDEQIGIYKPPIPFPANKPDTDFEWDEVGRKWNEKARAK